MARPLTLKVNKHVTYFDTSTPTRARAATITAIGSVNGGVILRLGHGGGTVGDATTGILREPFNHSATKANTWQVY